MKKYYITGSSIALSIVELDLAKYYISKGQSISHAVSMAVSII